MILAGDVGGTKVNLALFRYREGLEIVAHQRYSSNDSPGLEYVVRQFLAETSSQRTSQTVEAAAFGIAGPIVGEIVKATNLPWVVDARVLRKTLGIEQVRMLNDLEATGYGIPLVRERELVVLNRGKEDPQGHGALIAAGTGLGEAFLYRQDGRLQPVASEGGHCSFAPRDELEIELLRYLWKRWNHVSFERLVSGPGLFNIYSFLRDTGRGEEPGWLAEEMSSEDPAAVISNAALEGRSELCGQALDLFVSLYGAEAGNLALKCKATGGLFVGGGIAPKILAALEKGGFVKAFTSKGRLSPVVENIPVRVILNPKTALLGAARCARIMLTG